jgi:carbon monoxide dehydrogenase subunit G
VSTVSVSVDVAAPAARTWEVVTDWARQGEWMPQTSVVVDEDTNGVGTRMTARTGFGPLAIVDPMVIEVWEPPRRCEVRHLGSIVTGRGVFLVEPVDAESSRFTWQEILDSTGPRRILDAASGPASRALLSVAVRRLARLVSEPA